MSAYDGQPRVDPETRWFTISFFILVVMLLLWLERCTSPAKCESSVKHLDNDRKSCDVGATPRIEQVGPNMYLVCTCGR
jgi:hypothetical protein